MLKAQLENSISKSTYALTKAQGKHLTRGLNTPAVEEGCFLSSQADDALIPSAHGEPTRSNARSTGCLYFLVDFLQASPQCPLPVLLFAYKNVLSAPGSVQVAVFADISVDTSSRLSKLIHLYCCLKCTTSLHKPDSIKSPKTLTNLVPAPNAWMCRHMQAFEANAFNPSTQAIHTMLIQHQQTERN